MRRKVISSVILLSVVLTAILSLSAIYSGISIARADSVIATIPGLRGPLGVAFDSSNGNLYVSNTLDNTVSVISGQTNVVVGSPIPVGSGPVGIAFDSTNGDLYVTNFNGGTVSVISGQTNAVIGSISNVGHNPNAIAFDSTNGDLYVSNFNDNTVSVISGQTNAVIGSPVPVGNSPLGIAFDSANGDLYVTNGRDNSVSVISGQTNSVIGSPIPAGPTPLAIAFNSANGNLYVTNVPNSNNNTVSVISGQTNSVIGSPIPVGILPEGIVFDSANGNLYVTNAGDDTVSVIATTPQQPPHTTITSAVDGNGATVQNGSSTLSTSIRFAFTGTSNVGIAGFECSLDNGAFASCSSPATITNLSVGKHTFQVRGVDTLGIRDPTPAKDSWTIATLNPPTKTTITSAIDGNNTPVQNGGTTSSRFITFTFAATAGTNPIAGFQCSLDNSPFSSCTSPAVFNNLAAGPHKFAVVAVDTAGNKDASPATFSWTVSSVTPTQSIQKLIQLKHSMHLSPATDQTLDIRLNIASQFTQNNFKAGTCIQLTVFIKLVQGELRVGHVTSVQATQLIQGAQNIQMALGCTVASSGNGIVASSLSASQTSSLNLTHSQQQQPQTTASSPSLLQPQSLYPYPSQYHYPSQYPFLTQNAESRSSQNLRQELPMANAGISQTVNENARVTLDARASYSPTGGVVVAYQWTQLTSGEPVVLTGANTATPTLITPTVPSDTVLAFSLRIMDNHGAISSNSSIVYVMVKHHVAGGTTGSTPTMGFYTNQQQQPPPQLSQQQQSH